MADWRDDLRVGDVLRNANGTERIVRAASFRGDGSLYGVTFTILHCSWTGRCYTRLTRGDLKTFGYAPTGHRARLRKKIDRAIGVCIGNGDRSLSCCDVKGIR